MQQMAIDRRTFLQGSLGLAGSTCLPGIVHSKSTLPLYAGARREHDGTFSASLFNSSGDVHRVSLPARGHDVAVRPFTQEVVVFARRPGRFAVAFSPSKKVPPISFYAKQGRHFYGHGVFSPDGKLLYTTENDYENGLGIIGVWDATNDYQWIGEFSTHGIGPHDLALLDGDHLVIANGGIETHPEMGRQILNLAEMEPSLVYINRLTGDLVEKVHLPKALRQLSLRHLSVGKKNRVVFGCQYKGSFGDRPQLVGIHDRGKEITFIHAPDDLLPEFKNYIGSVATDSSGEVVAASSPRGNVIAFWNVQNRKFLGHQALKDGCGLAATNQPDQFLATSGEGVMARFSADQGVRLRTDQVHWDNHVTFVS